MKKYLVSLVLGVCTLAGVASVRAAGAAEDAVRRDTPQADMNLAHMPFEIASKYGQVIGFEVDLFKAMAKSMDVKLELVSANYGGTIPVLPTDKFGMIGSGMTLTQERNLRLNSFEPFIVVGQALLMRKELEDKIRPYKNLNDPQHSIASEIDTIGEIVARKLISKAKYHGFDSEPEAVINVVNDKAGAFIYDPPYNMVAVSRFDAGKLIYLDQPPTYEPSALGLKKGDYDNISFINNFLHQIREDDTYQRIHDKWFKDTEWLKEMERAVGGPRKGGHRTCAFHRSRGFPRPRRNVPSGPDTR